jgi:hypothetical protein
MITKKAAIGFILLAIITFAVATMDYQNRMTTTVQTPANISMDGLIATSLHQSAQIHTTKPILDFGQYAPLVMTITLEAFALVCYVVLKKVEPKIKAWEERVRKERSQK